MCEITCQRKIQIVGALIQQILAPNYGLGFET